MTDKPKAIHFRGPTLDARWACAVEVEKIVPDMFDLNRFGVPNVPDKLLVATVEAIAARFGCELKAEYGGTR